VTMTDSSTQAAVALRGVSRRFSTYTAVQDITLEITTGKFISIVGPSGCGKSTLLNMIAGLLAPTAGVIEIFGQPLQGINRRASYMFQQDALLPWKSVRENIRLGLTIRGQTGTEALEQVEAWVQRVGLKGFADHFPYQLSGGMRKRVGMAQCWIVQPDLILMDEPFGALDVHTRLRMELEILDLWTGSMKTVVFVTHDLEEAISLSDEVFLLSAGPAGRLVGRYPIDLVRPRNLIDVKTEPRFHELFRDLWSDLRQEVLKSYEQDK
jgi:NitT/TauT family transport system ATP-binding protein